MSTAKKKTAAPKEDADFIKIVYQQLSENARYYDGHVWQIPSAAVAVNAFLLGQVFSDSLQGQKLIQILVALSGALLTFVLLVALVKHRLHKDAQDRNIHKIEEYFGLDPRLHYRYNFTDTQGADFKEVEGERSFWIVKDLAPFGANKWLMGVMAVTILMDFVIVLYIAFA